MIEGTIAVPQVAEGGLPYICCAARQMYGISAVPPGLHGDVPDVDMADPADFGISAINEIYRTLRYHWWLRDDMFANPSDQTRDLASFYASLSTQNCPTSMLVQLEDAVLAQSVIYARSSTAPAIVYETHRPNDRMAVGLLDRTAIRSADRSRFADPTWMNFFVGSAGSSNYGHWLVDDLPRLKAVAALMHRDERPVRILIHGYGQAIDTVRIESIRLLLGEDTHIDLLDPHIPYHFDELFYVTPVTHHPVQKSPAAMDFVAREVLSRFPSDHDGAGGAMLLFVDRASQYGRTLSNHDPIRQLAEEHGFTTFDPAGQSFADQVRMFANAQVVIGQMGAAMTNTLFCRPTTTVIHLAPAGWIEPFYWDLSVVRGHHYRVLFGEVTDPTLPPHRSDFTIAPDALKQAIDSL
ncbi:MULTISPECIES: glycosyltransferase family 61 protein [unclassified Sphingomonas]|uniref:glycosyltransferase family 61 protein n=1 Tax=unclassified Sphingomonas TaxID=196159 RepID=UPI0028666A50|nr:MULTISPECIES: glycosyltransferase family 61 protein [unclassified Sphingomonas]MDR6116750.1 hypothetical protein [Sphingomonas sp. SORGH_AS_0789]MDR6151810.1 hypothetical protein [Sphingomonas sp. SORGH_AS_0742]